MYGLRIPPRSMAIKEMPTATMPNVTFSHAKRRFTLALGRTLARYTATNPTATTTLSVTHSQNRAFGYATKHIYASRSLTAGHTQRPIRIARLTVRRSDSRSLSADAAPRVSFTMDARRTMIQCSRQRWSRQSGCPRHARDPSRSAVGNRLRRRLVGQKTVICEHHVLLSRPQTGLEIPPPEPRLHGHRVTDPHHRDRCCRGDLRAREWRVAATAPLWRPRPARGAVPQHAARGSRQGQSDARHVLHVQEARPVA